MHALECRYRKITDFHQSWMDKVTVVTAEKDAAIEELRTATEWEKKFQEEVSHMTADL